VSGVGRLERQGNAALLKLEGATRATYSDAQLDDYAGLPRREFPWRPPLRMTVRARFSHPAAELKGTAGFGFWNNPIPPGMRGLPRLPCAVWFFFSSPPSNIALARDVPGPGWKTATFEAARPAFLALAPFALPAMLLMRLPALYRVLWPIGQRAIGVSEALLPVELTDWHTYTLEWRPKGVTFFVDSTHVHTAPCAPKGPLGFVTWLDNQYAVITPQGRFGFGFLDVPDEQWLALDFVRVERL
jgi:hypothetical protein